MMKHHKFTELLLIVLVAILFFIIGNMTKQLNIYAQIHNILSPQIKTHTVEVSINSGLYESGEISSFSLNKALLQDSEKPLKFLVAGHIYGNPYQEDLSNPAITLTTNLQLFNQSNLDMVILLGDIVKESTEENLNQFTNNFLNYIKIPVFNAVGNHEMENRNLYNQKFGETNFAFIYKEHLFIFLDTNIKTFTLTDNQLDFIQNSITQSFDRNNIKTIQIFAHHVFFYKSPFLPFPSKYQPNVKYSVEKNVEKFIEDVLDPISDLVPVYIYAGDVGAGAQCGNLSPYYDKFKKTNVITIATGIGNCEDDSVLLVEEMNDQIFIKAISLVGKEMMPIELYNEKYWKDQ
jgi:hypothetical protein